jgi:hypothetical protein
VHLQHHTAASGPGRCSSLCLRIDDHADQASGR